MKALREGEKTVNLPVASPAPVDLESAQRAIFCAPGCLAVLMDPPRTRQGDVLIPETVGARLRADCGTVVARGMGVTVEPGERVLVRPYRGLWIEPFSSVEPAVLDVDDQGLQARGRFVAIRMDAPQKWTELALPDEWDKPTVSSGRVVSKGADAWPVVGSRVVYSGFHRRTARRGMDYIAEDVAVVEDRQVFATLGPSSFTAPMVRFYGAGTEWRKSILMVWRPSAGAGGDRAEAASWQPVGPWVLVEREAAGPDDLVLPKAAMVRAWNRARVVSCGTEALPAAERIEPGSSVLVNPDSANAIDFDLGSIPRSRRLVHASSIWAVIS